MDLERLFAGDSWIAAVTDCIEKVGDERLMVGVRESHGIGPRTTTGGAIAASSTPLE
jgi:hypothetical protein